MQRIIREVEPPTPSSRLSTLTDTLPTVAAHRAIDSRKLEAAVRGELDWIVMKALEKDRNRRYQTTAALLDDISRYLTDQPINARPPTPIYRLKKFVRRNKVRIAVSLAIMASTLVALVISTLMYFKEHELSARSVSVQEAEKQLQIDAEARRAAEEKQRQAAQEQSTLVNAEVFYTQGNYSAAEKLLAEPLPLLQQPNAKHSHLRRGIGSVHAGHGEWNAAVENFEVMIKVDTADTLDEATMDYIRYGPVLIEQGDPANYRRFVEGMISRFAGTNDPVTAERVCKATLLRPADQQDLQGLLPFYNTALRAPAELKDYVAVGWANVALSMYEYRAGEYENAYERSSRVAKDPSMKLPVLIETARILSIMARKRMGGELVGKSALDSDHKKVENALQQNMSTHPTWMEGFDWMIARILLREAEALLAEEPAPSIQP
jgi:tetratricopeptide (TPR) repeat protein